MEKARTLIVTPTAKSAGGVETMNVILRDALEKQGYQVEILTADEEAGEIPFWIKGLTKIFGKPAITAYRFKKLKNQYEFIICNGEYSLGISHERVFNYFHGSFKGMLIGQKGLLTRKQMISLQYQSFLQFYASMNHKVIAVSHFLKEILNHQGIATYKVINNPVDTKKFTPAALPLRKDFIFVGSGEYHAKGFDVLEELAQKGHSIYCYTRTKLKGNLVARDFQDHEKMPEIYNGFKMMIFPSRFEANSMVVLEALSSGLPVIMTEVGIGPFLAKIIPEFVVPANASADVFEARIKLIESRYEEFCVRARTYILEHHSMEAYTGSWLKLLQEGTAC